MLSNCLRLVIVFGRVYAVALNCDYKIKDKESFKEP